MLTDGIPLIAQQQAPTRIVIGDSIGVADWVSAALALALIVVTFWYAKHTKAMVDEMRLSRESEVAHRRREKSDRAAYHCLERLRDISDEMSRRGASAVETQKLAAAHQVLRGEGRLIDDENVRDKLGACAEVLFVASMSESQLAKEGLPPGVVALQAQQIVQATRWIVEAYLAEEAPERDLWMRVDDGHGDHFPSRASAGAWIRNVSRTVGVSESRTSRFDDADASGAHQHL